MPRKKRAKSIGEGESTSAVSTTKDVDVIKIKKIRKRVAKPRGTPRVSVLSSILHSTIEGETPSKPINLHDDPMSVMNRPTWKARRDREQMRLHNRTDFEPASSTRSEHHVDEFLHQAASRMLRTRIFGQLVLSKDFFVYPTSGMGKEQPDLTMTCKAIRTEWLPIYYQRNIFALYFHNPTESKCLEDNRKWLRMLEQSGHLKSVKHMVFVHEPERQKHSANHAADQDTISDMIFVSLSLPTAESLTSVPKLEVHQDARCVLLGRKVHEEICCLKPIPESLMEAVVDAIGTGPRYAFIDAERVLKIIACLQGAVEQVTEASCQSRSAANEGLPICTPVASATDSCTRAKKDKEDACAAAESM